VKPLIVVPLYLADTPDLAVVLDCLKSIKRTAGDDADTLVVDDGSPRQDLVTALDGAKSRLSFDLHRKDENSGFSKTVNVGLQRALDEGRDAILVNADMEFIDPGWVPLMQKQQTSDEDGTLAYVVGGLLLYPNGLIQHAGDYFSYLDRTFAHWLQYGPQDLPEAQRAQPSLVTGALQFIRHECLMRVGIYDEQFKLGYEDVDYCIRVFNAGQECVYQPHVRAYHFESMFRGRKSDKITAWENESWVYFMVKYRAQSFARFIPRIV
jgi:GT2 family glycosyltransferase